MKFQVGSVIFVVLTLGASCREKMQDSRSTNATSETSTNFAVATGDETPLPPKPVNIPDLVGFTDSHWNGPHLPPLRFNGDGRLGLQTKSGSALQFLLLAPERLRQHFVDGQGAEILQADTNGKPLQVNFSIGEAVDRVAPGWIPNHASLCEDPLKTNPTACTDALGRPADCYKLFALSALDKGSYVRLASIPLTIRVDNPKSALARIANVAIDGKIRLGGPMAFNAIFEPIAAGDGRLLVGRIGNSLSNWTDSSGKSGSGTYDVVYSWYSDKDGSAACDASKWQQFIPISHAPYDTDVRAKYDFAKDLFRDSAGNVLKDGEELGLTYPWIDRQAKNIVALTHSSALFSYDKKADIVTARFATRCTIIPCGNAVPTTKGQMTDNENDGGTQGFAIMGAWTRGKLTLLDNNLNKADFGLKSQPTNLRDVALYSSPNGNPFYVTVGANRDTFSIPGLPGYVNNTTLFDSIGDRFAYSEHFRPALSRDVVWLVSNGTMTDELAFDDFLDRNVLLSANMSAPVTWNVQTKISYHDGTNGTESLLQNSAYISKQSPKYGRLSGSARVEPVAAGGRFGRGVFLNRTDSMQFDFPQDLGTAPLFISMFLDSRMHSGSGLQTLISFPDGGKISISDVGTLRFDYLNSTGSPGNQSLALPTGVFRFGKWMHLGFLLTPSSGSAGGFELTTYVDGMELNPLGFAQRPYGITPGILTIGGGYRGWVDEVRVSKAAPGLEAACNLAYGTLGALSPTWVRDHPTDPWVKLATNYPPRAHQEIKSFLMSVGSDAAASNRFVCLVDHNQHYGWSVRLPEPQGITYIHQIIKMAGKHFAFDEPRPDSTGNPFCLTCHTNSSPVLGLKVERALKLMPGRTMANDSRKQPTQPLPKIYGFSPAGLIEGSPESQGTLDVYRYLFP